MDLKEYIKVKNVIVNEALKKYLAYGSGHFDTLFGSMSYSVFAGGKRVRPVLCLAACEVVGGDIKEALPFACALEMMHTYSLIHDDLPCMDDDDLRRGKATNHKIYGEAQALLAGNSLLTLAYQICLEAAQNGQIPMEVAINALLDISKAIGVVGVIGGQSLDLLWENKTLPVKDVETVCVHKTASLIVTSVRSGAMAGNANDNALAALTKYGDAIGLAFQVADDILNVIGDAKKLGKNIGTDKERGKTTFVDALGLSQAQRKNQELLDQSLEALSIFGNEAWMLRDIARYIVERDH